MMKKGHFKQNVLLWPQFPFNSFFVMIGQDFASKILRSDTKFEAYISIVNTKLHENPLRVNKFWKHLSH